MLKENGLTKKTKNFLKQSASMREIGEGSQKWSKAEQINNVFRDGTRFSNQILLKEPGQVLKTNNWQMLSFNTVAATGKKFRNK